MALQTDRVWAGGSREQTIAEAVRRALAVAVRLDNGCLVSDWGLGAGGRPGVLLGGKRWYLARLVWGWGEVVEERMTMAAMLDLLRQMGTSGTNLQIRHRCGNKRCLEVDHLQLATRPENERDKFVHGVARGYFGPGGVRVL